MDSMLGPEIHSPSYGFFLPPRHNFNGGVRLNIEYNNNRLLITADDLEERLKLDQEACLEKIGSNLYKIRKWK